MKAMTRMAVIAIVLFGLIINAGCSVIRGRTQGRETETRIVTHTTVHLLVIPICSHKTIINKESNKEQK